MSDVMQKEEAHRLVEQMPANATWDDLMHEVYVRMVVEKGLADSNEGRTLIETYCVHQRDVELRSSGLFSQ